MGNKINKIDETAESIKELKQKGVCPFCKELVAPEVVEKNRVGRDRCVCPNCKESVYLCRTPSCHDYAKWTESYDHQFCPACWDTIKKFGALAGTALGSIVATLVQSWALSKINETGTGKKR